MKFGDPFPVINENLELARTLQKTAREEGVPQSASHLGGGDDGSLSTLGNDGLTIMHHFVIEHANRMREMVVFQISAPVGPPRRRTRVSGPGRRF